jgi:hypothetical protein
MAKDLEKNRATLKGNTAEEKKLREAYQQKNALLKEANRISKAQAAANAKLATAGSKQNRQLLEAKEALRAKNAQIKQSIALGGRDAQAVNMQNSSLKQLEKALAMNRAAFANMSAAQRNNQKVGGRLNATIQRQAQQVDKLRTSMGQAQQRVGGYREAFKKAQMQMMGFVMAGMAVIRMVSRSIKSFVEFNQSMAKVAAVSGASTQELKMLSEQAKELGISTEKSATQVGQLQLELSKKGFSPAQIQASTAAIVNLSIASGEELAPAAELAAGVMNAFGLQAEDMPRIVDVMAKSFSSSALDLDKFKLGMSKVAPVAKQLGLTIEQTTGYIGTLVDANVDAGTASAQLRNIFIELNARGMTMEEGMQELAASNDKVGLATELYGKRAAPIAAILADNIDKSAELTETLYNSAGAADEMAKIMADTLSGDIKAAKSAFEGLSIELGESNNSGLRGIIQAVTKAVRWIAENLKTFGTILKATLAFIVAYRVALNASALATGKLDKATKLFGKTLNWLKKLNPYALIAAGIVAAGVAIVALTRNTNKYAKAAEAAAANAESEKRQMNELFDELKKVNPETEKAAELRTKINEEYGRYLPNLITEKTSLDDIKEAQKAANDELVRTILLKARESQLQEELEPLYKRQVGALNELRQGLTANTELTREQADEFIRSMRNEEDYLSNTDRLVNLGFGRREAGLISNSREFRNLTGWIREYNVTEVEMDRVMREVSEVYDMIIPQTENHSSAIVENTGATDDNTEANKELEQSFIDLADSIEYDEDAIARFIKSQEAEIQKQKELDDALAKNRESFENAADAKAKLGEVGLGDELTWQEEALEFWGKYGQAGMDAVNAIGDTFRAFSERRQAEHELELHNVQENYDAQIAAAEGDAALVETLQDQKLTKEKEIQAEILAEKQKQAKIDKALALFNAAITGAIKIIEVSSNPVLLALTSAAVAAQLAAIAATPIPQFFKGTKSAPGGAAMVGERGVEAMFTPDGKISLTPDHATVMDIPKGTEILTHEQTNRFIKGAISDRQAENRIDEKDYTRYFKKLVQNTGKSDKTIIQGGNSDYRKRYVN